jgi:hypothetical protein
MRSDLAKCTTERGRTGSYMGKIKYGGKVRIDLDLDHDYLNEFGGFRSSARRRHHSYKGFTDVLGPLRGAIRRNLGRPWDKVFSEFCRVLDRRSLSGYHIWTHLQSEVQTNTFIENGKVLSLPRHSWLPREVDGFYVHPITGILCHAEVEGWRTTRRRLANAKPESIPVPGMEPWKYQQVDGLWFRVLTISVTDPAHPWKKQELITAKRSANRKEIIWITEQLAA